MVTGEGRTSARAGLGLVLLAVGIAGVTGYVIHLVVPAFADNAAYIAFSVFWSATFLVTIALSGVQQEIARASRERTAEPAVHGGPTLWAFGAATVAVVAVAVGATSPLWAAIFDPHRVVLVAALVVGAAGSTLVAVVTGTCYGLRRWGSVAAITAGDALLRFACIGAALVLGLGIVGLAWAIAVPFVVTFAVAAAITGRSVRRRLELDSGAVRLARHSLSTVAAATATGVITSGLPLLLGITSSGVDPGLLASVILVITLSRAPLIVPLQAVQSYLIVGFRDAPRGVGARLVRYSALLAAVTGALALAAGLAGPALLEWLYGGRYALDGFEFAVIVTSAGLTAVMFLTGPAVLARSAHGRYVAGWATASVVLIGMLVLPVPDPARVLAAICAAPVAGALVHLVALARPAAAAFAEPEAPRAR